MLCFLTKRSRRKIELRMHALSGLTMLGDTICQSIYYLLFFKYMKLSTFFFWKFNSLPYSEKCLLIKIDGVRIYVSSDDFFVDFVKPYIIRLRIELQLHIFHDRGSSIVNPQQHWNCLDNTIHITPSELALALCKKISSYKPCFHRL